MRDRSKDAPKSAAELLAELEADPAYVAQSLKRQREQQRSVEEYSLALKPLLKDLASAGVHVTSLEELTAQEAEYRAAMPVLIRWLPRITHVNVKEDIVRTLTLPWAKPTAAPALIEEFQATPQADEGLRWAIANALAVVADDAVFDKLLTLIHERKYGKAREMLALALGNIENPHALSALLDLLEDEQVVGHALMALSTLKLPQNARERISPLLHHPIDWIRSEAKNALSKIELH